MTSTDYLRKILIKQTLAAQGNELADLTKHRQDVAAVLNRESPRESGPSKSRVHLREAQTPLTAIRSTGR